MRLVDTPGMIGLACGEPPRTSDYIPSILQLRKPAGTLFKKSGGLGPANPFNDIAGTFIAHKHLQWLFLTNDDNLYPSDTLVSLLESADRDDADIVTGLYLSRIQPFEPVIFDKYTDEGDRGKWFIRRYPQPGESGMIPIIACGDGCLLIKRRVLEVLEHPWWEYGLTYPDACDHDMVFSFKAMEAGFKMWCNLDVKVDHAAMMVVRPHQKVDGDWSVRLVQADRQIEVAAAKNR